MEDEWSMVRVILDHVHDAILAHDMDRRIFIFNRAAEKLTGLSRAAVLGRDCHKVFPDRLCGSKCRFCDGEQSWSGEAVHQQLRIMDYEGNTHYLDMYLNGLDDRHGNPVGVIASMKDCTHEQRMERQLAIDGSFAGIIGRTPVMQQVFRLISDVADNPASVLIQGASGTGKELVAAAIHNEGCRASKLFVPVNCGALPDALLESELFGHTRGAFTGAIRDKKGRFELADGGTIFLDEIGDISPSMQVKLLRVLQEGTFERVGSEKTIRVDVRVISATNKNLMDEIHAGRFREDLYFRLNVVPIHLPPLSDRRTDIPLLVEFIVSKESQARKKAIPEVAPETMDLLVSQEWPGNIRELQNWLLFALIKCKGGVIYPDHLPVQDMKPPFFTSKPEGSMTNRAAAVLSAQRGRPSLLTPAEVITALEECGNNRGKAAKRLGVSSVTLFRMLKKMRQQSS